LRPYVLKAQSPCAGTKGTITSIDAGTGTLSLEDIRPQVRILPGAPMKSMGYSH